MSRMRGILFGKSNGDILVVLLTIVLLLVFATAIAVLFHLLLSLITSFAFGF